MKNYIKWLPLLLLFGCKNEIKKKAELPSTVVQSVSIQSIPSAELDRYRKLVEDFYQSAFARGRFNGSFLVAKNGQIIYENYSGYRDPRRRTDSITPNTSFHLASVSKTFTGMAVLKLWEEGKIDIEKPVAEYIPGFPLPDVSVKSLLNHRSGIPNYVHYMEKLGWDRKQFITNEDVLNFLIQRRKDIQIGAPDKRFSYSNTNYALLALLVERVTGQHFAEYMRISFFEPLGMNDTYVYTPSDSARSLSSYFYSGREYAFDYLDLVYGDKNIYSTVRDLLKWDQALQGGMFFKPQTLDAAYTGYSNEKKGINNYGLGWRLQQYPNNKKIIYHNGWWHGNRTAFYRLPDENTTIIALCNNDSKMVYKSKKLADLFGNYDARGEDDEVDHRVTIQSEQSNSASGSRYGANAN